MKKSLQDKCVQVLQSIAPFGGSDRDEVGKERGNFGNCMWARSKREKNMDLPHSVLYKFARKVKDQ